MRATEGGGGGLVTARPAALRRFASQGGSRTVGMTDAAAHVQATAASHNAAPADPEFAVRIPDLGTTIAGLAMRWTALDGYVEQVAAGFARADVLGSSPGGLAMAEPAAVDRVAAFPKDFNPLGRLVPGDPAAWKRAVLGGKQLPGDVGYLGGGFLRLPDGRLVPLVIPRVKGRDGKWYSADDGPGGDVTTLDGKDSGWVRLYGVRGTRELFDRSGGTAAALLIAATGGKNPIISAPAGDYAGLRRGTGRPSWYFGGREARPGGWVAPTDGKNHRPIQRGPSYGVTPTPGSGGATGVSIALNALDGVNKVNDSKVGAYDLVVERNVDGRERARLQVTTITVGKLEERELHPTHVFVDEQGRTQRAQVDYRGRPDPDVARITAGHRDDDPGYKVSERGQ